MGAGRGAQAVAASYACARPQTGDPLKQLQDALLQALGSVREDVTAQLAEAGVGGTPAARKLILKRAQLLLYLCRVNIVPSAVWHRALTPFFAA